MKIIQHKNIRKLQTGFAVILISITVFCSCTNKLDVKPDQSLIVPSTPQDYQAELDNGIMYTTFPSLGELGTDDYYLTTNTWNALDVVSQSIYIWSKEIYNASITVGDWNNPFLKVRNANLVLEGLQTIPSYQGTPAYNNAEGSALFYRAFTNFAIAQVFCKPYIAASAGTDLGIPLSLHSNLLVAPQRVSVLQTYQQIIADLTTARPLLPATTTYKTRPSQLAVDAMLARVYLSMSDYNNAMTYSNTALSEYSTLIDYNTLSASIAYPFPLFNNETIFYAEVTTSNSSTQGYILYQNTTCGVDTNLYKSYAASDLRKSLFFTKQSSGLVTWRGNYTGKKTLFGGLSTNELYLTRAECYARNGDATSALADLNTLLQKRWTGIYVPVTATSAQDALNKILTERRKELLFRAIRWTDLRRLNQDPNYAVTISRNINGQVYTLPPNSPLYVYPIPPNEINLSGMQQNPR